MTQFFQFEADFVDSLRCVPMQVRYKLDNCGIKLKLHQWSKFSESDRKQLVELPCQTAENTRLYREHLQQLVQTTTGEIATDLPVETNPNWENSTVIPVSVTEQADQIGVSFSLENWQKLTTIQRFVLIKLSRSSHENHNFLPALKEFQAV